MDFIRNIYLKTVQHKFYKPFKPLGIKRSDKFIIAPSQKTKEFLKTLSFLAGIRKLGSVFLLVPEKFLSYIKMFKPDYFQIFFYKEIPRPLTREFDFLKKELNKISYTWLIDLNPVANLNLPNLVTAEKRVAFYDRKNFPFYNILIKGGIESLINFFHLPSIDPLSLFKFNKLELRSISKELPSGKPRLFYNQIEDKIDELQKLQWQGSVVHHINNYDDLEKSLKKLYLCDAYLGPEDEICEMARIFKKEIVTV